MQLPTHTKVLYYALFLSIGFPSLSLSLSLCVSACLSLVFANGVVCDPEKRSTIVGGGGGWVGGGLIAASIHF